MVSLDTLPDLHLSDLAAETWVPLAVVRNSTAVAVVPCAHVSATFEFPD
jgi:hypothetical protein